ncbi:hypothetical protein J8J14_05310 [Roseomonas sp. SSH11]|uniref:Uncharacterized protein n=1 Tax=Pararoseomonas baculiformis TaxID=2820812 RepID=A0ABS4ACB4_9PROT|nr:hypothetical protein [Pararoseomonas baculiformis]MBP0444190.1 hypothetical protein [Pararoseomonas baculiformis]
MILYGDLPRHEEPCAVLAALREALQRIRHLPAGLDRHAALVATLIRAGELAQGLADAAFQARGMDAASPAADAAMALVTELARHVWQSWQSAFTVANPPSDAWIAALEALPLPARVETKRAEGFAFYALYPEAYGLAASALPRNLPVRVMGLRSIGTSLSAMVAAARDAPVPRTLRPVGHPFLRELAVEKYLAAAMLSDPGAHHAIVDEGPGLSGSSFGAAMAFLAEGGVPLERMHLMPGHAGMPGGQAPERDRERWARVARHPASFDALLLDPPLPAQRLESWAASLLGPATCPMEEISGGGWRRLRLADEAAWPPVHPFMERRKFLFRTAGGTWLLKFAGLGREGELAAHRARRLHEAGFTPPVAGLLHGFLAERWLGEALPLDPARVDRDALIRHLQHYLGFRSRQMPAAPEDGASAATLFAMARANAEEALGLATASRLDRWQPHLAALEARFRRCWTDNRMHAWEWLSLPDGSLLKTDAVDHAAAHDLLGCQDIAWDIAGATVELRLSRQEQAALLASLGRDRPLLDFLMPCYLAFQLGYHSMAADAFGWNPAEATRASEAADRYAEKLQRCLRAG